MPSVNVDVSEDGADSIGIECEVSWFVLSIGEVNLTVSFEQLDAIHNVVRPYFVEESPDGR